MPNKRLKVAEEVTELIEKALEPKPVTITSATIKDGFCNYSFEITAGVGLGDKHMVNGKGIVMDDMEEAFSKFNVHIAHIDDMFKHSKTEVADIDTMHNNELALLYTCSGFKVTGTDTNESVILLGSKYVSGGGRIKIETPKVSLDEGSSYKWYNELKDAVDNAREEVLLYRNGKYIPVEKPDEEVKADPNQLTIFSKEARVDDKESDLSDFDNAKV